MVHLSPMFLGLYIDPTSGYCRAMKAFNCQLLRCKTAKMLCHSKIFGNWWSKLSATIATYPLLGLIHASS